jgi:hypothetical protein
MPKQTATRPRGFPCRPDDCFENRHMTAPQYVTYSVMKAFAVAGRKSRGGQGPILFYASVKPTLCNALNYSARSAIDRILAELWDDGWIIKRESKRKSDGTMTPTAWEIVEHKDFAASHPGSCPDYPFAPDSAAGEEHGVKRGQKRTTGELPANFEPQLPDSVTGDHVSILTEGDCAKVERYLRFHKPSTTDAEPGDVTQSHKRGSDPVPQTRSNRSHNQGLPSPANAGGSLIKSNATESVCQSTISKEENNSLSEQPTKPKTISTISLIELTDRQKAKPQLCEELKTVTVREFFRDVSDDDLIPKLSAGLLASVTVDSWVGDYWKRDKPPVERATKDQVIRVCRDVISCQNERVISQMSHLGNMMAKIMIAVTKATCLKVPKPWLPTTKKLETDYGPLLSGTPLPGKGTLGKVFESQLEEAIRYCGIDVEPNVELLDSLDLAFRQKPKTSWRECWQLAALLLKKDWPDSAVLIKLRDHWWGRDAMPDKPASPPWDS